MKKHGFIILAGLLLCGGFGFYFYWQKPAVMAGGSLDGKVMVMQGNEWILHFSVPVSKKTVNSRTIAVKDSDGHEVGVGFELNDEGTALKIVPPAGGYPDDSRQFTLSISSGVKTKLGFTYRGDTKVAFTVTESLPSFGSTKELASYFQTIIKRQKIEQERFSLFRNSVAESSEDKASSGESSGSQHSETNNQVQGVDEGDVVKTDGTYIYQVANGELVITRAIPSTSMEMVSRIPFEGNIEPRHLFLEGDNVVVIGNSWMSNEMQEGAKEVMRHPIQGSAFAVVYDISDRKKPNLLRKVEVEGNYMTSRKIGGTIYFIANSYPDYWLADKSSDVDLRPRVMDSVKGNEFTEVAVDRIQYFPQSMQPSYTMIASLDVTKPKGELNVQTYLGSGSGMYMSKENLYLAVEKFNDDNWNVMSTEVYKFGLKDSGVMYKASGQVPGRILNQFSMDEHDGYFRVATTDGEVWNDDRPSSNALYLLDENMKKSGDVTNLAKGERIYSVRFLGDKAYIVTFKQVDPLFVIDTADPRQPKVLGELKIPGFSTYLHPIDENHLIGFGFDTKIIDDGKSLNGDPRIIRSGMKISLFDITDFENPKEADTEIIGGTGTHSPLMDDHKALFHEPSRNLYGFPVSVYHDKEASEYERVFDYQGALLYEITPEHGIEKKAVLGAEDGSGKEIYESWEKNIQRLLYIDDHVYTLANQKIEAYSLNDFQKESSLVLH
ncbi:beta-propeller domain-containing protein [Rossellomorea aquimaris]|uniref:beta-propeller domain-containing protein n=1 Tax=Rossellomorea aquimaris TaxID=189382 RepID=UPI001CD27CB7|nr:beta-propeller domain-containing protein [Rossellomorea aquimaris]MCA1056102.1 beta-propeller domain-containing protein [Rossellomorea aquimaris]